ncbi:hypothetical protein EIP91_012390 [Steccherinum ochraceum]|uniref:Fungal-type protein kinase domain-containing protein n=1 Tax=Steccherinum ochraceum TaxID=92696 RepID=A0A4R0RUJ0_9APHY|nr:hypothetical protein EIP91_012390 [Steccherinum ochraceum]
MSTKKRVRFDSSTFTRTPRDAYGWPLEEFKDVVELITVIRDSIEKHRDLHSHGILHKNVRASNILICPHRSPGSIPDGSSPAVTGSLIDLSHAQKAKIWGSCHQSDPERDKVDLLRAITKNDLYVHLPRRPEFPELSSTALGYSGISLYTLETDVSDEDEDQSDCENDESGNDHNSQDGTQEEEDDEEAGVSSEDAVTPLETTEQDQLEKMETSRHILDLRLALENRVDTLEEKLLLRILRRFRNNVCKAVAFLVAMLIRYDADTENPKQMHEEIERRLVYPQDRHYNKWIGSSFDDHVPDWKTWSAHTRRTRIHAFMSAEVLSGRYIAERLAPDTRPEKAEPFTHTAIHDIESFFWVLLFQCLVRDGPGGHCRPGTRFNVKASKTAMAGQLPFVERSPRGLLVLVGDDVTRLQICVHNFFSTSDANRLVAHKSMLFSQSSELAGAVDLVHPYFDRVKPLLREWWTIMRLAYEMDGVLMEGCIHDQVLDFLNRSLEELKTGEKGEVEKELDAATGQSIVDARLADLERIYEDVASSSLSPEAAQSSSSSYSNKAPRLSAPRRSDNTPPRTALASRLSSVRKQTSSKKSKSKKIQVPRRAGCSDVDIDLLDHLIRELDGQDV